MTWHVSSEAYLSSTQSPTQKVGMGLVVKLQAVLQLTNSVTFLQIKRVLSYEYSYRSCLIICYSSIALVVAVIIWQVYFNLNQVL